MVKIDTNNKYEVVNEKYEYDKIALNEFQSKYIRIPLSIILDTELDAKRIGIFSYLRMRYGLDSIVGFTIPDIVEWCGGKPDRRPNGSNDKTLSVIDSLISRGYLTYITDKSKSSFMKCKFNTSYYYDECNKAYAAVYLDEIEKIMNYKKENEKDGVLNNTTILLVFSYLRNKIHRRSNKLEPEERYPNEIKERRKRFPDAFGSNAKDIADEIGISSKTLSKIIDILEYELELIVTDRPYRIKNENDEFRTLPTIFANAYKREDKYLLITGDDYSRTEIELKADNMKQYYQGYKINKNKRKK